MTGRDKEVLEALREGFNRLLNGEDATPVDIPSGIDDSLQLMAETLNRFLEQFSETRQFAISLAAGDLDATPPLRNEVAASFKQLHAGLKHLTWQTKQIAKGDYSQRVHFMGDFSGAFNAMVESLAEKKRTEDALQEARKQVRHLEGIIPICMYCKKIRNDENSWQQMEQYISAHSEALFSHGVCPSCLDDILPETGD